MKLAGTARALGSALAVFVMIGSFGCDTVATLLAPAIRWADEGFPVSEVVAKQWADASQTLGATEETRRRMAEGCLRLPSAFHS